MSEQRYPKKSRRNSENRRVARKNSKVRRLKRKSRRKTKGRTVNQRKIKRNGGKKPGVHAAERKVKRYRRPRK